MAEVLPTNEDNNQLLRIRHSTAHVMAMAVQELYTGVQVTIGPWIDNGFYYDFYKPDGPFTEQDLKQIKKRMDKIIKKKYRMIEELVTVEEARARIEAINEPYKLEILDSIIARTPDAPITLWHIGESIEESKWWDLCGGPHVNTTGDIPAKAVSLQSVAGAYWRGDEKRDMLTRIYGTAWETPQQLKAYKKKLEEAKKRDHRVLGKKLNLFSIQEDAGGGLVFWHPKGSTVRRIMEDFWKEEHIAGGYDLLYTPHVANLDLWKTSGHYDFYKEGMFDQMEVEGEEYQIKPMNCPFHCLVYKEGLRSYRDLPIRWAELGTVYRYERSGTLHGLMRVRGFTQDDAHIFCLPEQLTDEIVQVLDLTERILSRFGFEKYQIMLSTRPEKSVGSDEIWTAATAALVEALGIKGWDYAVDEGGGAFYGPKIDLKITDAIGRTWQCSTIQCDFNLPDRFGLEYVDSDSSRQQPIMLHRAIFGSVERFFGVLIESTAGELPLWLAPQQMRLLPVTEEARIFCEKVAREAKSKYGLRVETVKGDDRLAKLIRNAEQERVPLMAVVGEREIADNTLSVRSRKAGDLGVLPVSDVLRMIMEASAIGKELNDVIDVVPANEE